MDWLLILIALVAIYAISAYFIYRKKLWTDHIIFYGPIMAIKTARVKFFDKFTAVRSFFKVYGTVGVIVVIIVSVFMTVMLFVSIRYTLIVRPEPTGIYEPQNILLLPGINDYVPSTFAVWFAFFLTIVVHEFGHAILCRVEEIKVKGMGVLLAVIPIGFFVEPDEEELEKTKGMPKVRMFGAGITNNLVVGFSCFGTADPAFWHSSAGYPTGDPWDLPGISGGQCKCTAGLRGDRHQRNSGCKPGRCLYASQYDKARG